MINIQDIIFCYDFDRLTPDGLLYDAGPLGLHATPGAGAAAPTRQLDGSYLFAGGSLQNFYLAATPMARFYANAPTGAVTWLSVFDNPSGGPPFSCRSTIGGLNYGLYLLWFGSNLRAGQRQGGAGDPDVRFSTAWVTSGRRHVVVTTLETTPRGMWHDSSQPVAWNGGAFGTTVYDATAVPRIGSDPNFANSFTGRLYYLALLRGAVLSSDLSELSAMLCNGFKPFCVR